MMIAVGLAMLIYPTLGQAVVVDLGHPTFPPFLASSIGTDVDRSVVFDANSTFSITMAGIRFAPLAGGATSIAVDIYASNLVGPGSGGALHGALLATASIPIANVGLAFYDIPINFTFPSGNRFDLAFRSLNPGGWGFGVNNMEFFNFDFFFGDAPYVAGPVTVIDGACHPVAPGGSFCANYANFVMPHVRFDTGVAVPEPSTLLLLGAGLIVLVIVLRRPHLPQA
jgi:hypothetical protein